MCLIMNDLEQSLFLIVTSGLSVGGGEWGYTSVLMWQGRKQGSELKISMAEDVFIFMGGRFSFLMHAIKCCLQMLFES